MKRNEPLTCNHSGGRYWDRTSDLFGVNEDIGSLPRLENSLTWDRTGQYGTVSVSTRHCSGARLAHELSVAETPTP
jgi:hypothetical protein